MGSQVNLYLPKSDIDSIENYLKSNDFIFVKDAVLTEPKPVLMSHLFQDSERAKYITLPQIEFEYRQFEQDGLQKYRIQPLSALAMQFGFFGEQNGLFRIRFYYRPSYFDEGSKIIKSNDFEVIIDAFFDWIRANFQAIDKIPDFYQNSAFPVGVAF